MNKSNLLAKFIIVVCSAPLICVSAYWGMRVHDLAAEREAIRRDYSNVNSIIYGILSVDAWKQNIEEILTVGIRGFELTPSQRDTMEAVITGVLRTTILKADSLVRSNHSLKGELRTLIYRSFVDKDEFMKKAPMFSRDIVDEMLKKKNKERIKNIAVEKLHLYAGQTYGDTTDMMRLEPILIKYHASDKEDFNRKSNVRIDDLQAETYKYSFLLGGMVIFFLLAWLVIHRHKGLQSLYFGLCVAVALIVLLTGITTPMIEIDARIDKIDFTFLGSHLQFNNQVLFYQSKSILQVVQVLTGTGAADSMVVGILILAFSVLFPVTKLLCTQVYLFGKEKIRKNKIVYFFAFKSGKWSMADVMVVAILMAYIGFKGILDSQLRNLNYTTPALRSIATNHTSLQPAFILFLVFVLYGLVLSEILKLIHKKSGAPVL